MNVNIEVERVRSQLTKEQLASRLGVTSRTYLNYVRGDTPIPSDVLLDMAKLFHCTTDYLLGRETGENKTTSYVQATSSQATTQDPA